ncbi:MAG: stage III sporulation protein AE [Candidatus Borkfalkiaceae bacterium]|nr:stage III sporulation protein AE [Clostridia bacterium]MDY6224018.1 stage III sporulation protein AE [Christensenellaceae bacterium]
MNELFRTKKNDRFNRTAKRAIFFLACLIAFSALFFVNGAEIRKTKSEEIQTAETSGKDALNESIYNQIDALDLGELQKYVDSLGVFDGRSVGERLIAYIGGESFDYGDFFSQMLALFFKDVQEMLPSFASIAAVALLCGVFAAIRSTTGGTEHVTFFITFSAVLLPVLTVVTACFTAAKDAVNSIDTQIQLIFPVLLTLMSVSGEAASAAVYTPAAAFLSTGAVALIKNVLLPMSVTITAFSAAGNLSPALKLNRFSAFFKSMYKWLMGVSVSVFGIFFTAQGFKGAAYDGIMRRAAKYAIGTGVPIVGGFLSGGFDLAVAGGALIKNSVGYLGMILLLAVVFKPLVMLIAANVLLRFTAAVSAPMGESRISDFLSETADNVNFCLAGVLMAAFMYFVTLLLCVCFTEAAF